MWEQSNPESRIATDVPSPLYSTFEELKIPVSYTSTTFVTASAAFDSVDKVVVGKL